jgi:hypothetical protein
MPWPPVDELVGGRVQRSYLNDCRWWLDLVLNEFAFLEPLGYSLPQHETKGVHFHQKGNYVWFEGPRRDVVIEYDPESSFIRADLWESDASTPGQFMSLDEAVVATGSAGMWPARSPLDRPTVEATIRWWAKGLRANAANLLAFPARDIQQG